jgi:hypothetical protein
MARLLCVKIGQPVIITLGEYALFRRDNRAGERWVEKLDVAWQQGVKPPASPQAGRGSPGGVY